MFLCAFGFLSLSAIELYTKALEEGLYETEEKNMSTENQTEQTAIKIEHLTKIFSDKTQALDDVSFQINKGDFLVLAGSNGSGKSVLMSLIAGLDDPTSGTINVDGEVGLVFQDADAQILGETPFEDVSFGAKNAGLKKTELQKAVEDALKAVGLENKATAYARSLSGGEKRRLAVAGILAMQRQIIIFDEPFANLDWPGVKLVCQILVELKQQGNTIILLTHEIEKVLALANRFIVLDKGKIRFDGTPEQGLNQNLEQWFIKNPLTQYQQLGDLLWL